MSPGAHHGCPSTACAEWFRSSSEFEIDGGEKRSIRTNLEDPVHVCQDPIGADQEPSPQHRVDAANPRIDPVDRGWCRCIHDYCSLPRHEFNGDWHMRPKEPARGSCAPALRWTPCVVRGHHGTVMFAVMTGPAAEILRIAKPLGVPSAHRRLACGSAASGKRS